MPSIQNNTTHHLNIRLGYLAEKGKVSVESVITALSDHLRNHIPQDNPEDLKQMINGLRRRVDDLIAENTRLREYEDAIHCAHNGYWSTAKPADRPETPATAILQLREAARASASEEAAEAAMKRWQVAMKRWQVATKNLTESLSDAHKRIDWFEATMNSLMGQADATAASVRRKLDEYNKEFTG